MKAPWTSLNPTIGFELQATRCESDGSDSIEWRTTALEACTGPFKSTTAIEKTGDVEWYAVKFGSRCRIMIRALTLQGASDAAADQGAR